MNFYDEIEKRGLLGILKHEDYVTPTYIGWEKVKTFLLDIVVNSKSVYVEGDYDVDGLCCLLVLKNALRDLGVKNLGMYHYRFRTHNIDKVAVQQCIRGHYDYFIVADTGSSDIGLLRNLTEHGVRVIVLDHHRTNLSYDDFGSDIAVINTEIENSLGGGFQLSAGALCFTVMDLLYQELGKVVPQYLAAFAMVSLFSDVMPMGSVLNRSIYYLAVEQPESELPSEVLYFKGKYSKFNARYVGYWLAPRINACFRTEQFIVINELFISDSTKEVKNVCISLIEEIYESSRTLVDIVSDMVRNSAIELNNFVYADLGSIDSYYNISTNKLYNYTGLVANRLADSFGKTGVVVCEYPGGYKGSLRDQCGKNYLPTFKQICDSGGHGSAFGFTVHALDLSRFYKDLINIDRNYSISSVSNNPIVIDVDENEFVASTDVITDIARYNEFSSIGVPVILLRKRIVGDMIEQRSKYYYKYLWGDFAIQSDYRLQFGKQVFIKPLFSGQLKLFVQHSKVVT